MQGYFIVISTKERGDEGPPSLRVTGKMLSAHADSLAHLFITFALEQDPRIFDRLLPITFTDTLLVQDKFIHIPSRLTASHRLRLYGPAELPLVLPGVVSMQ